MRRHASRFLELSLGVALSLVSRRAAGQPCCAGASALTPARLTLFEDALVGLEPRVTDIYGSFDQHRRFAASPAGAEEVDLEQDLVGSVRFLKRAQASVLIPFDETYRKEGPQSQWGGGIGDLELALRYDFLEAGQSKTIPGIALLASTTFPTGRPPEDPASGALSAGATGTGSFQAAFGASLEQLYGPWLVDLTGSTTWRAPRTVGGIHEQDGELFAVSTALAYSFEDGLVLATSLAYTSEIAAIENGVRVPNGGKSFLRAGLSAGYGFRDHWRGQATVFSDLPIRGLGENEPTGFGASVILIRSWTWS